MSNWAHQNREREHFDSPARGLLWSMRTGKSKSVIDLAQYHLEAGRIDTMIIVAPNGVHKNWVLRELPKWWTSDKRYAALAWSSKDTTKADIYNFLNKTHADMYIVTVNVEALRVPRFQDLLTVLFRDYATHVLGVFDESHLFRTPGSKVSRIGRKLAKRCTYRRILTGTAALNSPLHLWSQFELLEPGALGFEKYKLFENRYGVFETGYRAGGRTFPKLVGYRNLPELREAVSKWVTVVPRDSVPDMPPLLKTYREVPLSTKQDKAYEAMWRQFEVEISERETVTATEAAIRINKLQQILSGFLYYDDDPDRGCHVVDAEPPRFEALYDEVVNTEPYPRAIVWCRYRYELEALAKYLKKKGVAVVQYHGGVKAADREYAIDRFQSHDDETPIVFLGQPMSAGMGLELSNADVVIWYSHTYDAITHDQATERGTKLGESPVQVVYLTTSGTVDTGILAALQAKQGIADIVTGNGLLAFMRGGDPWSADPLLS